MKLAIPWNVLLYESHRRKPGRRFTAGLKHNTETMAKPDGLGPAQNDESMQNFVELSMFCSTTLRKVHSISCPEYIEDLDKCIKM